MEEEEEEISWDVTIVFWNLEDYPIPEGADLGCIHGNIVSALYRMGFDGTMVIRAYGDPGNHDVDALRNAGIIYFPESEHLNSIRLNDDREWGDNSAVFKMPLDMISWVTMSGREPPNPNLVVIAKRNPEAEWHRVLECLQSRDHPVVALEPPDFNCVESLVQCRRDFGGSKSLGAQSKFLDFSERVEGANLAVFWDLEDCPFPHGSDPDEIYGRIDEAVRARGVHGTGEISVWAYVDEKKWSSYDKAWGSRIYFLPGGASRRNRMFNDILLWAMDTPLNGVYSAIVTLVSNQFGEDTYLYYRLRGLSDGCYGVLLVTPTPDLNKPDSLEWPDLLIDEAYVFPTLIEKQALRKDSHQKTTPVLWNLEDYPILIPDRARLHSIFCKIQMALERMKFRENTEFWGYGELQEAGIATEFAHYFPETSGMPRDMIACAASSPSKTLVVIAKQGPEKEWHRVLQCLQSRNHTVLLLEPPDDTAFEDVESLIQCTQAFGGGKPTRKAPSSFYCDAPSFYCDAYYEDYCDADEEHRPSFCCDVDNDNAEDATPQFPPRTMGEDLSKIRDFSGPITPGDNVAVAVFWDVVDRPFLRHCSDPDEIYRRIEEALDFGRDSMAIWVYVDEHNGSWSGEYLRNKTWETRIYFLPGGVSRRNRMLNDILLWDMDYSVAHPYPYPAHVFLVSDQVTEATSLLRVDIICTETLLYGA
ncbi:unnamed protein product [Thlaspi arvense]|uniref:NYN domain-containing protein n=1 Tax=Thlaspi arvense TaxID=13288 RepID=A0AAU9RPM7_THLAR|nr:unnamed protein product [Thlaspi arvense]